MKILIINTGSSSIKYRLFDMETEAVLASGLIEKIGAEMSIHTHKTTGEDGTERIFRGDYPVPDHRSGLMKVASLLTDEKFGSIKSHDDIAAVGHRVVHGGEEFNRPTLIDDDVIEAIRKNVPLAPLHNPANLTGIEVAISVFPGAKQVAVFDTAFHQTMPDCAYMYAIPYNMYQEHKIRRYGFHGTSHSYVSKEAARFLGRPVEELSMVTVHLGNGSSMAAVKGGRCVDTTMGMTPLAGLIMGTRCGDLDPAVSFFMAENFGLTMKEIDSILNRKSGFLGICGMNDVREITEHMRGGCTRSKLALDMLSWQIKKYIGAYSAAMGGLDAVVFTAGIGENSIYLRWKALEGMEFLGIDVDPERNRTASSQNREISSDESRVKALVIPTNEELQIARESIELLNGSSASDNAEGLTAAVGGQG
jgi:acetate kinase